MIKNGNNYKSYPVLTQQIKNLSEFIGVDKFLDIVFNRPQDFYGKMKEISCTRKDKDDIEQFLKAFDIIWKNENKIIKSKIEETTNNSTILEFKKNESEKLSYAKSIIIGKYMDIVLKEDITTIEDFKEKYDLLVNYMTQLNSKNFEVYEKLLVKIENLSQNIKMEEILSKLDSPLKELVEKYNFLKDLRENTSNEKLDKIIDLRFCNELFKYTQFNINDEFNEKILRELLNFLTPIESKEDFIMYFFSIIGGLGKIIKEKNWNTDRLSMECSTLSKGIIYNLYETNYNNSKILGMFFLDIDSGNIEELSNNVSKKENVQILNKNSILLTSNKGKKFEFIGGKEYIDEFGYRSEIKYYSSHFEIVLKRLKEDIEKLLLFKDRGKELAIKSLKNMGEFREFSERKILLIMIEKINKKINKLKEMINDTDGNFNTIECIYENTTKTEFENILNKILITERKRDNALIKKGLMHEKDYINEK